MIYPVLCFIFALNIELYTNYCVLFLFEKEKRTHKHTSYLDPGVDTEQCEKSVHVYEGLPGLSVDCTQEVEREGELEEQAVHHHQVSHGHRTYVTDSDRMTQRDAHNLAPLYRVCIFG